jgi:hypothetical protein
MCTGLNGIFMMTMFVMAASGIARGQASNGPVPIDKAAGRVGTFQVLLNERSPLSKPSDVAIRISQKLTPTDTDYDLAKEPFETFVPKSAGDDGKYGLMIPMPFGGHGFPPRNWIEVLERHHMIWMGDSSAGDGRAPIQRIGLVLDAVHNAEKVWPIDPARVYVCPASSSTAACAVALYYPEVFRGQLCAGSCGWYTNVTDPRTRSFWKTTDFAQPKPEQFGLARSQGRFFFVGRREESGNSGEVEVVAKEGYGRAGFKHIKTIVVPASEITVWSSYPASWFDQGVEFLDSGAADARVADEKIAAAAAARNARPAGAAAPPPGAATTGDDASRKAAAALSLAKSYINAAQYDAARKKLQSIVQSYSSTPSAAEAAKLLKDIQDK